MINRSQVLEIVEKQGPISPRDISREIRESLLMVSAVLSELTSSKKILISNMKIGSSPLYYVEGQEIKLQSFSEKLPSEQKNIFNRLKDEMLLKDSRLSPQDRISIRGLKDFAFPVIIKLKDKKELFWKWYLALTEEIHEIIKKKYLPTEPKSIKPIIQKPSPKIVDTLKADPPISTPLSHPLSEPAPSVQRKITETPNLQKEVLESKPSQIDELKVQLDEERKKLDEERKKFLKEKQELEIQKQEISKIKASDSKEETFEEDSFYKELSPILHNLTIIPKEVVIEKKAKELKFLTEINSDIGKIPFIVKASSKKRITIKDLESLNSLALEKKSPVLFMFKGTPSKKLESELKNYPLIKILEIKEGLEQEFS